MARVSSTVMRFSKEKLRRLREERGYTQAQLARRATVREQQIIRWEGGRNAPGAHALCALAAALRCEISDMFENGEERPDSDDDEESDLLRAAYELDRAGSHALADRLRARVRELKRPEQAAR